MPRKLLVVAALVVGMAASAVAAPAAKMQILSFTGQIQIKIGNEVVGVVPGGKIPEIPAGAEIIVVSGEAVLQSGDTVIKADAGDSFSFTNTGGNVQIAATGEKTSLSVSVGGAEATVEKGEKIEVAVNNAGKASLSVVTGNVSVTVNGQTSDVAAGQTAPASTTTTASTTPTSTTQTTTTTESTTPTTETTTESNDAPPPTSSEPPPPPPPSPAQDQAVSGSQP